MNQVILIGRLTREPEIKAYGNEGGKLAKFSIATQKEFGNKDDADYHNCVAFGKTAEFVENYLHQGTKMVVRGRLENNNYEKDGVKHYGYQITVEKLEFCESKKASEPQPIQQPTPPSQENVAQRTDFMDIPEGADEELPFNDKK